MRGRIHNDVVRWACGGGMRSLVSGRFMADEGAQLAAVVDGARTPAVGALTTGRSGRWRRQAESFTKGLKCRLKFPYDACRFQMR